MNKFKIRHFLLTVLLFFPLISFGQNNTFDASLSSLTDQLSAKLNQYKGLKIAVWDLSDLDGGVSPIGKYIAEDVSINMSDKFHMVNRNQLNTLLKENKLKSEGFIDQVTMKQLKRLGQIDIIITGTVTVLSNNVKITLQALDSVADIIGATKGDVPMNDDIKELLTGTSSTGSNKGFNNHPLNSNEQYNNSATVNQNCQTNNTGDYCFENGTSLNVEIYIRAGDPNCPNCRSGHISLTPGQTQCFYSYTASVYRYEIDFLGPYPTPNAQQGEILVEQCKSKSFKIK